MSDAIDPSSLDAPAVPVMPLSYARADDTAAIRMALMIVAAVPIGLVTSDVTHLSFYLFGLMPGGAVRLSFLRDSFIPIFIGVPRISAGVLLFVVAWRARQHGRVRPTAHACLIFAAAILISNTVLLGYTWPRIAPQMPIRSLWRLMAEIAVTSSGHAVAPLVAYVALRRRMAQSRVW